MEIIFESTDEFEQDLKTYSEAEQSIILEKLHESYPFLLTDKGYRERRLHQFYRFDLLEDYQSSLYSFIVNYYLRVLLTIDDDPLFNRTLITLYRVVDSQVSAQIYQEMGESIYRDFLPPKPITEVKSNNGTVATVTRG